MRAKLGFNGAVFFKGLKAMAVFAIGDVHGQKEALMRLLDKLNYSNSDELWFVGDLINRGPDSWGVLQLVRRLNAVVVLGNHDYSLLVQALAVPAVKQKKETVKLLENQGIKKTLAWLRTCKSLHVDSERGVALTHAGLYPFWQAEDVMRVKHAIEQALQNKGYRFVLASVYGNEPDVWSAELQGIELLRFGINALSRMRYLHSDGAMDFEHKMALNAAPNHLRAWFEFPPAHGYRVIFGHWANVGLKVGDWYACIDGGSAWGGQLVAFDVDNWCVAASVAV